jgi:hypothetical protein
MVNRSRFVLALAAALVLAGASTAMGNRGVDFSVAEGELGRVRLEARSFSLTHPELEEPLLECEVVFTVSLHRSIAKSAGALAGAVNEWSARNCRYGTVILLSASLPWHITYVSFTGTLPSISSLRLQINNMSLLVNAFGGFARCLYSGNIQLTSRGSPITEFRIDETIGFPLAVRLSGSAICPETVNVNGTLRSSPSVRMTLNPTSRCATSPAVRVDEAFQRQEGANATIAMTAQVECESTRIDSIRTTRANESIGIEDRERAVGRTFRRGDRFRYDLRLTAREGTRTVEETVDIGWTEEGGSSRSTTRVRFTDLAP